MSARLLGVGFAEGERRARERAQRIARAERTRPADVEVLALRPDGVRGRRELHFARVDCPAPQHNAGFVELRPQVHLALTLGMDSRDLHRPDSLPGEAESVKGPGGL